MFRPLPKHIAKVAEVYEDDDGIWCVRWYRRNRHDPDMWDETDFDELGPGSLRKALQQLQGADRDKTWVILDSGWGLDHLAQNCLEIGLVDEVA
jgi:hypothetical protein